MAGNVELVDEIIDIAAIEQQKKTALSALKQIKEAINSLNGLSLQAKVPDQGYAQTAKNVKELIALSGKYKQSIKDEERAALALARAKKLEADAAEKTSRAKKNEAQARKTNAQAAQAEQKAAEGTARASEREEKSRTKANNANREAQRAYKSLVREYTILRKVAEDYGASLGVNSKQYIEAAKRADELNNRLKAIDKGIGNSQRNVGNYASGFNGLSNSFNQITRELPAFTNSVQTGFLAISNNLPILFDEIGRARQQIVELRKAGEPAPSLFKTIAGSFFTLGTALSLGVTALTIFGPQIAKFVQSLFQGKQALDKFTESQRILGETLKNGGLVEAAASVSELRINIDLAKQGLLDKDKVLKQYNESIGKTTGEVKSLDEAEQALVKNGDAYIKMMLLKAAAQTALEDASKKALQAEIDRRKREEEFLTGVDQFAIASAGQVSAPGFVPNIAQKAQRDEARLREQQSKARKEAAIKQSEDDAKTLTDIAADFQKQAAEIAKNFKFDFFGGTDGGASSNDRLQTIRAALFTKELEDFRDQLKKLSEAEELSVKARQNFRVQAGEIDRKLLQDQAAFELQLERDKLNSIIGDKNSSKNARINAENEFAARSREIEQNLAFDLIKINRDTEFELLKIKKDGNERILEENKKLFEQLQEQNRQQAEKTLTDETTRLSRTQALIDTDTNILVAAENKKLTALEKARAKGKISDDVYVEEKKKIETRIAAIQLQAQVNSLKAELTYAERILAIRKSLGEDTIEAEREIARIRKEISGLESQQAGQDPELDRIAKLKAAYRDLANELKNTFAAVVNGVFENQKNQIQDQIDLIEQRKQREIEAINASAVSEQEKADKIKILEAAAAAQREQLELKQRQIQQRQARFQKALTIAEITAATAKAIIKQLAATPLPAGAPLVALIAATGAAQLATVLATPIPRYKEGTDYHKGGLAIVGDGGVQEVIKEPGKAPYLSPDTDTLMNLPRGTRVFPSLDHIDEEMKVNAFRDIANYQGAINESKYADMMIAAIEKSAVKGAGMVVSAIKNQPRPAGPGRVRYGSDFTNYINKRIFD
ncbi:hypothetical protein Pan5_14 [Pseudanabaena phage Pan5]|nr:hypothetical protein Pan5_14 [Pseudanabaena phage Pan5]